MNVDKVPIEIYINLKFQDKDIIKFVENWRVESEELRDVVVEHFREMGIFQTEPTTEPMLKDVIRGVLANSPKIVKLVARAERRAALLKGRNHEK